MGPEKYLIEVNPKLEGFQKDIAIRFANMTRSLLEDLPVDNDQRKAGLRKLLEAKDCFVRASLD